jgi:hypothetical protein
VAAALSWGLSDRVRLIACDLFYGLREEPREVSAASMERCAHPRGTVFNSTRRTAMEAGCRRWQCRPCGRRKARKVSERFSRLGADFLMTVSLPRSAWATSENTADLQRRCRWLLRFMRRHGLFESYGWVREQGAARPECVCAPTLQGCACGANGRQLHRHFLLRLAGSANRFGRRFLPYEKLQAAAKRCGLGTLDFQPVFDGAGAAMYVSKYLSKSLGEALGRARRYALSVSIPEIKEPGWAWDPRRVALVAVDRLGAVEVDWDAVYWDGRG